MAAPIPDGGRGMRKTSRRIGKKDAGLPNIAGLEPTPERMAKGEMATVIEITTSGHGRPVARRFPSAVERLHKAGRISKEELAAAEAYQRDWILGGYTGAESCQQWRDLVQGGGGLNASDVRMAAKQRHIAAQKHLTNEQAKIAEWVICLEMHNAMDLVQGLTGYKVGSRDAKAVALDRVCGVCTTLREKVYR